MLVFPKRHWHERWTFALSTWRWSFPRDVSSGRTSTFCSPAFFDRQSWAFPIFKHLRTSINFQQNPIMDLMMMMMMDDWLIHWLIDWVSEWVTEWLVDWLTVDWLFDWWIDWLIDFDFDVIWFDLICLLGCLVDCLLACCLLACLVDWLIGWLIDRSIDRSIHHLRSSHPVDLIVFLFLSLLPFAAQGFEQAILTVAAHEARPKEVGELMEASTGHLEKESALKRLLMFVLFFFGFVLEFPDI